ncbi:MAG: MurNAc alpha-1-phosphate uridylyltransferase [Gammaproteobacteria bacterium]|jgi:MurNAc alpha-1-phosphate uridylyltransferase
MTTPILLFAAGFGTRMSALTADQPKPLVPVAGTPLIDHALALTHGLDVGPVVINLHYKGQMIRDHLSGHDVTYSDETDGLLETGGGLRKAAPLLAGSPVVTLNTDAVWAGPSPIAMLLAAWKPEMEALLVTIPKPSVHGHLGAGDFNRDPDGRLTRGAGDVYSGLQMIRTDDLVHITDAVFSMNVVWDRIAARGGLFGVSYTGQWCDVGQPESIATAENMIEASHV